MATQTGVGFSQPGVPLEAGRCATEQALEPLSGREPALVVLFSTTDLEPGQVLAGVRAAAGEVPLIGGCGTGVVVSQGAFRIGVVVLALRSEEMQVVVDIAPRVRHDPMRASQTLARRVWGGGGEPRVGRNGLLLALMSNLKGK